MDICINNIKNKLGLYGPEKLRGFKASYIKKIQNLHLYELQNIIGLTGKVKNKRTKKLQIIRLEIHVLILTGLI